MWSISLNCVSEEVAPRRILDEQHFQRIPDRNFEQVRQRTGDRDILGADAALHVGQFALHEVLSEKRPVVRAVHSLQYDALHRAFSARNADRDGIGMYSRKIPHAADLRQERLVFRNGNRFVRNVPVEVDDLNMGTESAQFRGDLALESENHAERYDHYGDADRDAQRGDAHHYVVFAPAGLRRDSPRQEIFEVQSAHIAVK